MTNRHAGQVIVSLQLLKSFKRQSSGPIKKGCAQGHCQNAMHMCTSEILGPFPGLLMIIILFHNSQRDEVILWTKTASQHPETWSKVIFGIPYIVDAFS